jgi:HAD superfamily hydrolase (TIGR01484 family)
MEPFSRCPAEICRKIRFVLTDIDDTLTCDGRLAARTYDALEQLHRAGFTIVPVTAAPAGWCDQIARMWPVDGVIGENGGFYFVFDHHRRRMYRRFWLPHRDLPDSRERLTALAAQAVQGVAEAQPADHAYREITVAIEFATKAAHASESDRVADRLRRSGANAAVNSLWVIGWLGDFDKLAMARRMMAEVFALDLAEERDSILYVGDSPNDEPMFGFFPNTVGVSTVRAFAERMEVLPKWVTEGAGGAGFVEVAETLLRYR